MSKTQTCLTAPQFKALSLVLAEGGLWSHCLHMGRLRNRPGTERKTMIFRLEALGLVRAERVEDPDRQKYADAGPHAVTTSLRYFATAAGCAAWRAHDDAERFAQLTQLDEVRA